MIDLTVAPKELPLTQQALTVHNSLQLIMSPILDNFRQTNTNCVHYVPILYQYDDLSPYAFNVSVVLSLFSLLRKDT
jgi:hypothetical protein